MRLVFNLCALITALSFLGNIGSVVLETLSGYHNFSISGTELTITFSPIDRILLGTWIVGLIFTAYFWNKLSNGRR